MKNRILFIVLVGVLLATTSVALAKSGGWVSRPASAEAAEALAAIGTAFTYQGSLTEGGSPASGSYDFRFTLYDAAAAGNPVGALILLEEVAVEGGIFTVQLDFGDVFDGTAYWLEIAVRPGASTGEYTLLAPRQALTPSPYAVFALQALSAQDALYAEQVGEHNHLGETWNITDTALTIEGAYGTPGFAPLVLSNSGGNGLSVDSASSAGVAVNQTGGDGIKVVRAGNPSTFTESISNNGFEVAGAQGYGLYIGWANSDGIRITDAGDDGIQIGDGTNLPSYALFVTGPGTAGDTLLPNTSDASGQWALFTTDSIEAANVALSSLTLVARVDGEASVMVGDLLAASGYAEPLPGAVPQTLLVRPADELAWNGLVGVVQSRMVLEPLPGKEDEPGGAPLVLRSVPGVAQPGDYVAVTVMGVAQVRIDPSAGALQTGQRLTASSAPGYARPLRSQTINGMLVSEGAPVIGYALGSFDPLTGSVPAFINLR